MNRKLITAAYLALILAGCGDKNDSATGIAEPGMMDKAMDSTGEVVDAPATEAEDTETLESLENMDKEEALENMDKEEALENMDKEMEGAAKSMDQ
jgi:hypothetical protein